VNYRHTFHAGNFADVFKHVVLVALTKSFLKKDAGFCYLDTHAGIGHYDLLAETTQKSKEYSDGVERVLQAANPPTLITDYVNCIQHYNPQNLLRFYPGSPEFVNYFLRTQDRMVLCELHPEDYQTLKKNISHDKRIAIHHQNGYQGLKAFLPPKEKRGLILIDPPYEKNFEFSEINTALQLALKRFETGIYAIWYPIKNRAPIDVFHREMKALTARPILISELCIYPDDMPNHLNGSGMIIINPPFQLDIQLNETLAWLWKVLSNHAQSDYQVKII
jgi:23S rRNA (adenine2030-N6)-methyltransferase